MSRYQDRWAKNDIKRIQKENFLVIILLNDYSEKLVIDILQYLVDENKEVLKKSAL